MITVVVATIGKSKLTGRTYPLEEWQDAIRSNKNQSIYGQVGMPDHHISIDRVTHKVDNLRIEGDSVVGDVEILNAPRGMDLQRLLEQTPSAVSFRVAGAGVVSDQGIVTDLVIHSINAVPNIESQQEENENDN